MLPPGIFVTGTDTGVGKTLVSTQLTAAAVRRGLRVGVMKPVASGAQRSGGLLRNDDALQLIAASGRPLQYEQVNPYCFEAAIAPNLAASDAGVSVDPLQVRRAAGAVAAGANWLVVEGIGGWRTPLGNGLSAADLALTLHLPVLLVVGLRLGCLNHAALTFEAIEQSGLPFAGWISSHIDPQMQRASDNLAALAQILGRGPLAVYPWQPAAPTLESQSDAALRSLAPRFIRI
jgi:dethiobiotin synthetase